MANYILTKDGELMHYGVKGMKWGVRRYQNADGSLTAKGQKRFVKSIQKSAKSRKARKDMFGKTSDMLKEELDRETSFKNSARKLRKLVSEYEKLEDDAFKIVENEGNADEAFEKVDRAWDKYVSERNRTVDSLLGKYADTPVKAVHWNNIQLSDAKTITMDAIDKLSEWRYRGMS